MISIKICLCKKTDFLLQFYNQICISFKSLNSKFYFAGICNIEISIVARTKQKVDLIKADI